MLGLIVAVAMAGVTCGRTRLDSVGSDAGTVAADGEPAFDALAKDGPLPKDVAADAATTDRSDLGGDSAGSDAPIVATDSAAEGGAARTEAAADSIGQDVAPDGGGQLCTGTLRLGGFLPMGTTGATPASVALGDLDGDGQLDLVTANILPATVSVSPGRGNGTFAPKTDHSVGDPARVDPWGEAGSSMLAMGDVNGDGKLDLATVADIDEQYHSPGEVRLLLGKGDGAFFNPMASLVGASPSSVALGDVDGDGGLDEVTANYGSSSISGLFGINNTAGVWCATGDGPGTLVLGDVNADGTLDYVTVNVLASSVSALLGAGDGTCTARLDSPSGRDPQSLPASSSAALGDVDADGTLDLVVATSSPSTVSVLLGNGDGSFAAPSDFAAGDNPLLIALRDLDGDGKLDIVAAATRAGTVGVLRGQGDGTFAAKVDYPGVRSLRSAALGDLDRDGNLDVAMAGPVFSYAGWTSVLFGSSRGTFVRRPAYPTGVELSRGALADLNGDGKLDVAAAGTRNDGTGAAVVLLGAGDGSFAAAVEYPVGDHPASVALADLNDDGKVDLVTTNRDADSVSVMLGAGDGTFAARVDYPTGNQPSSVALADVDADGRLDMVAVGYKAPSTTDRPPCIVTLLGTGGGRFAAALPATDFSESRTTPQAIALGDLDGDGKVDIALAGASVEVLRGKGDGTFAPQSSSQAVSPGGDTAVLLADLDGDGSLDIVAASFEAPHVSEDFYGQGMVTVSLGKSEGSFVTQPYRAGYGAQSLALGDLNQDGKLDIVTVNTSSYTNVPTTVSVLFGEGNGSFAPGVDYPADAGSLALGDVNGDGKLDVVTTTSSGSLEVLFGACR